MKHIKITPRYVLIFILCLMMVVFDGVPYLKELPFTSDDVYNRMLSLSFPLLAGGLAVHLMAKEFGLKLFQKPQYLWVLLPGLIIALDNLPWLAYYAGKLQLAHTTGWHFTLFAIYCLLTGFFEEVLFRGIFLSLLAGMFENSHKGLIKTYIASSVVFGVAHLLNVFTGGGGAAVLQAGYSILTGGLFGFVMLKTKNVLFPALIHGAYNFCGLLFTESVGLGYGSMIDVPTGVMMAIMSVIIGVFVLYKVWKYPENERLELYKRLNIQEKSKNKG